MSNEHEMSEIERLNEDCRIHLMKRHEAEADLAAAREALARVAALVDSQWRINLGGAYEHTAEAFAAGRNWMIDQIRAVLPPATDEGAGTPGPHSRACGIKRHEHGRDCHANCPTCGGTEARP